MEKIYYICVIIGDFMKLDDFILDEKKFEIIEKQAETDLNGMPDNIKDAMDYNAFQLPNIQFEWSRRFKRQKYVVESLKDELKKYIKLNFEKDKSKSYRLCLFHIGLKKCLKVLPLRLKIGRNLIILQCFLQFFPQLQFLQLHFHYL